MCNYLPSKFESFRKHTLSSSWTSWTRGILRGMIMLWGEVCLVKVVCYIETGFLNIPTPVKMTPYPPRLQFQTSWTGGILTQKMTLWRDECLGASCSFYRDSCPEHLRSYQDHLCLLRLQLNKSSKAWLGYICLHWKPLYSLFWTQRKKMLQ